MKLCLYLMIVLAWLSALKGSTITQEEMLAAFVRPVKCTQSGLRCFLRHVFNKRLYTQTFLPRSFMHMIDLIGFGQGMNQPRSYYHSVISLFHERFQESHFVNPYALHELLQTWSELIPYRLFIQEEDEMVQAIAQHLKVSLKERFAEFKHNPYIFLDNLSKEIYDITQTRDDIPVIQLQMACTRFLDQACNKVIWDPYENSHTWTSFKELLDGLALLYERRFIADELILNQLVWALVYRFAYFIECAGAELTLDCYHAIQEDLEKNTPQLLLLAEQEELLTTKVQKLHHLLMEGEIKARAKLQGIITDSLIA